MSLSCCWSHGLEIQAWKDIKNGGGVSDFFIAPPSNRIIPHTLIALWIINPNREMTRTILSDPSGGLRKSLSSVSRRIHFLSSGERLFVSHHTNYTLVLLSWTVHTWIQSRVKSCNESVDIIRTYIYSLGHSSLCKAVFFMARVQSYSRRTGMLVYIFLPPFKSSSSSLQRGNKLWFICWLNCWCWDFLML